MAVPPPGDMDALSAIPSPGLDVDPGGFPGGWPWLGGQSFETEYGGAFFLANVALALDLYPDFTRPAVRGMDMDFWAFLLVVSRDLLGERPADPLWGHWRQLAGLKNGEEPHAPPLDPAGWRIPPAWLATFDPGQQWTWRVANGRLRVMHGEGFPIVDVPSTSEPDEEAILNELTGYTSPPLERDPLPGGEAIGPATLMDCVVPYIRSRLARALDGTPADAGRSLIVHPASVEVWPESIRVYFSLDSHPIAIRLAGLDRDPGWIPAAGRAISFAFD